MVVVPRFALLPALSARTAPLQALYAAGRRKGRHMSDKSPQKHSAKKPGKSLKDKRIAKKAKKADKRSVL
jgi:hypothetical protein